VVSLSALLLTCGASPAYPQNKRAQEIGVLSYNLGFGIVTTTIGSLINKPKHARAWPFVRRAVWQGALGGALQYSGKRLTYVIPATDNYWAGGWGSKIVHSAGVSICQNAAQNRPFGQYWVLDYGPARLNFTFKHSRLNFQPQFNLLFIYDLWYGFNQQASVNWKKTIQFGSFAMTSRKESVVGGYDGFTTTRTMVFARQVDIRTFPHELVHIYQNNEFRIINTWFDPLTARISNRSWQWIFRNIYIELPYLYVPYFLMGNDRSHYYRNYYEFEAEFSATNSYVPR